ncbi:MAG TPA: PDZ domain-containing protein [Firmicutes bacterium]|nr:PDZ domain-containing protein [Bacillota bacterium]
MNWKEIKSRYLPYAVVAIICSLITSIVVVQLTRERPTYATEATPKQVAVSGIAGQVLGENTIADVAERVSQAVVNIDTKRTVQVSSVFPFDDDFFRFFFGESPQPRKRVVPAQGSGFIIKPDGYILTNKHVVEKASEIKVTLADGRKLDGKLVGQDPMYDLAVVKINASNLPTVELGDSSNLRPGSIVIAIGNPYELQRTVTAGIISGVARSLDDPRQPGSYIQTDAAINPGNSGGPLVDIQGRVIGINTAIIPYAQGIGFAIPINQAKSVLNDLITKGKVLRPWIGIYMQDLTKDLADALGLPDTKGAVVTEVQPNSPAEKAGLASGDVIREVDGKQVENSSRLADMIRAKKIGDRVILKIWRSGGVRLVAVTLGEMPAEPTS